MDILKHNQQAWNQAVKKQNPWTRPVTPEEIAQARNGIFSIVLTPFKPVPAEWLGDVRNKKILCLAASGGQQAPLLAAAGAEISVLDNSTGQLAQDKMVADREGLSLTLVQGNMQNLSAFENETFDLIIHPISNCFIDNVLPVWQECARVLKPGAELLAGFVNPVLFIFDLKAWDDEKKLSVRYKIPYADTKQLPQEELDERLRNKTALEFGHSLEDQIAGQLKSGFALTGFYEDIGGDLLDDYLPSYIASRAKKVSN